MRLSGKSGVVLRGAVTVFLAAGAVSLAPSASQKADAASPAPALSRADVAKILDQGEAAAKKVMSAFRSIPGAKRPTKMQIAVVGRDGRLLQVRLMTDAWEGSIDIAIGKARTAALFSSNENALTSRIIGQASQAHTNPDGTGPAGPLWGIGESNQPGISGSSVFRNGIITFPGGVPLYKGGSLVGGVGVSGDAVDQDEAVAFGAAAGFEPGADVAKLGLTPPTVPPFP